MGQENRVVTVTINPAIDQTITIPNFTAGAVNRVQSSQMDAGGKGINVASFLADFGQPATVTGFLGADNDAIFRRMFERKGINDRCVRIAGQTRIGVKVSDEALHQTTDINFPGETPTPADRARSSEVMGFHCPTPPMRPTIVWTRNTEATNVNVVSAPPALRAIHRVITIITA
jgi:fructose-1-phosphate kinase PfkB-like protein